MVLVEPHQALDLQLLKPLREVGFLRTHQLTTRGRVGIQHSGDLRLFRSVRGAEKLEKGQQGEKKIGTTAVKIYNTSFGSMGDFTWEEDCSLLEFWSLFSLLQPSDRISHQQDLPRDDPGSIPLGAKVTVGLVTWHTPWAMGTAEGEGFESTDLPRKTDKTIQNSNQFDGLCHCECVKTTLLFAKLAPAFCHASALLSKVSISSHFSLQLQLGVASCEVLKTPQRSTENAQTSSTSPSQTI